MTRLDDILFTLAAIALVLAVLLYPAYAGPDRTPCHKHGAHTHCHR